MKFVDFLNESSENVYKKKIDEDTALDLVKNHCNNIDFMLPFIRGMNGDDDFYLLEGRHGGRNSVTNSNMLLKIVDKLIVDEYPGKNVLIANSILFATNANARHTRQFGENRYYILPYNDADLLYTSKTYDFNYMDAADHTLSWFKESLEEAGIAARSYESIIDGLQKIVDNKNVDEKLPESLYDKLISYNNIDESLKKMLDFDVIGIKLGNNKTVDQSKRAEVWTGDKVIAIKAGVYNDFYKKLIDTE